MACIRSLQHARYAHCTNSQVTDRRIQLRRERGPHLKTGGSNESDYPRDAGDRPPTVPRHDSVQGALHRERQLLIAAHERLIELEKSAKDVIQELEAVRGYLSQDAAKRRFALE